MPGFRVAANAFWIVVVHVWGDGTCQVVDDASSTSVGCLVQRAAGRIPEKVHSDLELAAEEITSVEADLMPPPRVALSASNNPLLGAVLVRHRGADSTMVSRLLGNSLLGDPLQPTRNGRAWTELYNERLENVSGETAAADMAATFSGMNTTLSVGWLPVPGTEGEGVFKTPPHGFQVLLMFFGCLTAGSLILLALERQVSAVPYRGAVLVLGVLVRVLHCSSEDKCHYEWVPWGHAVDLWKAIDPHVIYFAFLPPLVLGRMLRFHVHLLRESLPHIAVLALLGVMGGAAAMAWISTHLLRIGWTWRMAFVFGLSLTATNSSAMAAFFDDLGASLRLGTILSGEGVLSECIAAVLALLMIKIELGGESDPDSISVYLFVSTVPALGVGYVWSKLTAQAIKHASGSYPADEAIQVVLIVCCGYVTFYIAELVFSSSGIIATATAGYYMASSMWTHRASQERAREVWRIVEFAADTLTFFLLGVVVTDSLMSDATRPNATDFRYAIEMFIILIGTRVAVVYAAQFLVRHEPSALSAQEGVLLMFCGAPSSVSMALVLAIAGHQGITKAVSKNLLLFVAFPSALWLAFGSAVAKPLLRGLGLTRTPLTSQRVIGKVVGDLAKRANTMLEVGIKDPTDSRFHGANRNVLFGMVPSLHGDQAPAGLGLSAAGFVAAAGHRRHTEHRDLCETYREVFLRYVISHYKQDQRECIIPLDLGVLQVLVDSAERALLNVRCGLNDWDIIADRERLDGQTFALTTLEQQAATMRCAFCALCYQEAHKRARLEVAEFFATEDPRVQAQVNGESTAQAAQAAAFTLSLPPPAVNLGRCEMLSRRLIKGQYERVEHMCAGGILAPCEASHLQRQLRRAERHLVNAPITEWLNAMSSGHISMSTDQLSRNVRTILPPTSGSTNRSS